MIVALQVMQGHTLYEIGEIKETQKDTQKDTKAVQFVFDVVDIDLHPALELKYGDKVPVLLAYAGGLEIEICHYFMDEAKLHNHLRQAQEAL